MEIKRTGKRAIRKGYPKDFHPGNVLTRSGSLDHYLRCTYGFTMDLATGELHSDRYFNHDDYESVSATLTVEI